MKNIPWTKGPWILRVHPVLAPFVEAPRKKDFPYALDVCGDDYMGYGGEKQRAINMELITLAPEMADVILNKEFGGDEVGFREIALKLKAIIDKGRI
jgi:hypothetical protein